MELFAVGVTLQRWSSAISQSTVDYVDYRQVSRFWFLSKMVYCVDSKEMINLRDEHTKIEKLVS